MRVEDESGGCEWRMRVEDEEWKMRVEDESGG